MSLWESERATAEMIIGNDAATLLTHGRRIGRKRRAAELPPAPRQFCKDWERMGERGGVLLTSLCQRGHDEGRSQLKPEQAACRFVQEIRPGTCSGPW